MAHPLVNQSKEFRGQIFLKRVFQLYRLDLLISHVFRTSSGREIQFTAGYCDGGEWSGEEVEAQTRTIFETFFLRNSPAADIISNHGVYDDGWMVQQLFPGQTENPQTESER